MLLKIMSVLLGIWTVLALLAGAPAASLPHSVWGWAGLLIIVIALWLLYRRWLGLDQPFRPRRLWGLSALFAGVMTLGESFLHLGTAEWVTGHKLSNVLCAHAGFA